MLLHQLPTASNMDVTHTIAAPSWQGPFDADEQEEAVDALEAGKVLVFSGLEFPLLPEEADLLTPEILGPAKNVSLDPCGRLKHAAVGEHDEALLQDFMGRFARAACALMDALFPAYAGRTERARTSFRPAEIEGRRASVLKDDTRLHVDAFPTTPMRGRRILRLFANVNAKKPRLWNVGEPFEDMAVKLLPGIKAHRTRDWLLATIGATKGMRSAYDDLMLGLHNRAKLDDAYRRGCPRQPVEFPPGAVWMCFTDQVMHAALKGQHALEQTFHVPVECLVHPERAPLRVLERMTGQALR
jgi:hypothetical protein